MTQSGLGQPGFPLGWGRERVVARVIERIRAVPEISSKRLAEQLVFEASRNDGSQPKDDITCGVAYFRRPRRLLVITGPPFAKDRDAELAARVLAFQGRIALCGGTTATILSRELDRPVEMNLKSPDPENSADLDHGRHRSDHGGHADPGAGGRLPGSAARRPNSSGPTGSGTCWR